MRDLYAYELSSVSGGCDSPSGPCHCPDDKGKGKNKKRNKGNNGFGNNGNDGTPNGFQDETR